MAKKKIRSKTRRGNNEGSIYQRSDGRWAGVATAGYNENGKTIRKTVYGKSRLEVVDKLNKLMNKISSNNYEYIENTTIGEMINEWLLVFKKMQVSPRTFEHTYRNFKLHIDPKIGNMKIDEVDTIVIQKVLNEMLEEGYSLAVVKKVKFIFNQFFNYAVDNKLATNNPTTRTRVRSNERKVYESENKYKAIPPQARDEFLSKLNTHEFLKPLCMCMMFAGLRTGEVLALTWEDIDFKNKTINIKRAITTIPKFDEKGKVKERVTVISETKTTCSVREVPMPDVLIQALEEWKENRHFFGRENNVNLTQNSSLVFGNSDGSVRSYSGTKSILERFLKSNKLDKYGIHFHGLRHTYSNMLFENNENPKVIQALLGHKSVKTTITTYNSVDRSYFQKTTDKLNKQYAVDGNKTDQANTTQNLLEDLNDDELDKLLELLEKRKRKKEKDFEM